MGLSDMHILMVVVVPFAKRSGLIVIYCYVVVYTVYLPLTPNCTP